MGGITWRKMMSSGQTHGGKGGQRRPTADTFGDNWDKIYNKKKKKEEVYKAVNEVLKEAKLKEIQNEN